MEAQICAWKESAAEKEETKPGSSTSGPANSTEKVDCQDGGDGWDIIEYNGEGRKAKGFWCMPEPFSGVWQF